MNFAYSQAVPWKPNKETQTPGPCPKFLKADEEMRVTPASFGKTSDEQVDPPEEEKINGPEPEIEEPAQELDPEAIYQQGYMKGKQDNFEECATEQLKGKLSALQDFLTGLKRESGPLILEIATCCAERILGREIAKDEDWVLVNISTCLGQRINNGKTKIRLSPSDQERILSIQPLPAWAESNNPHFELIADPALGPGDCILDSDKGRVDGRIERQLANLRDTLHDLILDGMSFENSLETSLESEE